MKRPYLVIAIVSGLLPLGCQSPALNPSRMTAGLFGKKDQAELATRNSLGDVDPKTSNLAKANAEYAKAEEALKKGNLKEARKLLVNVVQLDPQHVGAHHRLAFIADKHNEYQMAELHYLTAHRLQPRNVDIACDLGYSYLLQERYEDSRRFLEKALAVNPQHQPSLLNLASLHAQYGDYDGALALFRQAGSEEQAQANIAQVFPGGPPSPEMRQAAAMRVAQMKKTAPATRDLQQKLAQSRNRNQGASSADELDLNNIDPREISPHQMKELFARIDDQYERNRLSAPPISPNNGPEQDDPRIVQAGPGSLNDFPAHSPPTVPVLHTQPQAPPQAPPASPLPNSNRADSPYFSSLPGELPTQSAETSPATSLPPWGQPASTVQAAPSQLPLTSSPPAAFSLPMNSAGSTAAVAPFPGGMPAESSGVPASRQKGRLQLIDPQATAQAPPAPIDASSPEYQQALMRALQMGMNAGPGQMFPVPGEASRTPAGQQPSPSANTAFTPQPMMLPPAGMPTDPAFGQTTSVQRLITPTGGVEFPYPPAANHSPRQVPAQSLSQIPTQHSADQVPLLQSPLPQPTMNHPTQATQPYQSSQPLPPSQQNGMSYPAGTYSGQAPSLEFGTSTGSGHGSPVASGMPSPSPEIRDWPHAPQQPMPAHSTTPGFNGQTPQQAPQAFSTPQPGQNPAASQHTLPPWMQQSQPTLPGGLPTLQPHPQPQAGGYVQPQQWQYAPDSSPAAAGTGVSQPYVRSSHPATTPSATTSAPLPQVVPGVR